MVAPFPLISVSGSPRERGIQYGKTAKDRVRRSCAMYSGTLDQLGLGDTEKDRLIDGFLSEIGSFDAKYVEEMIGIAEGAEVRLSDIVMLNARTEVVAKARLDRASAARIPSDEGCTGAVILPSTSSDGRLVHGQNWDWRSQCVDTAVVLKVSREDGPDFLTFVEAGGLARSGLNAAGISITANYLESDLDHRQVGVPLVCLRRKVLEQEHLSEAFRVVAAAPKACSNNMMIASAEGFALDFECAPNEVFLVFPDKGMIVHANHFTSPVALGKLTDKGVTRFPDTLYRDWRVRGILDEVGKPGMADLKRALADTFAAPYSVCRPPVATPDGDVVATVASIVMIPAEGIMDVAPMPAEGGTYSRYSLHETAARAAAE